MQILMSKIKIPTDVIENIADSRCDLKKDFLSYLSKHNTSSVSVVLAKLKIIRILCVFAL